MPGGALRWLRDQGHERLGGGGTSSRLVPGDVDIDARAARARQALNQRSPFFADVVWRPLNRSKRRGLDGHVDPTSCGNFGGQSACGQALRAQPAARTLLRRRSGPDLPVDLSVKLVDEFARPIPTEVAVLPCGHYSTGKAPFKFLDGYYLARLPAGTCDVGAASKNGDCPLSAPFGLGFRLLGRVYDPLRALLCPPVLLGRTPSAA